MADLIALLNQTGLNIEKPALYQLLKSLIDKSGVSVAASVPNVESINADTRNAPVDIYILTAIKPGKFYIISDIYGNAAANPITLVGVIDGVADPQITADYGTLRVYATTNGYSLW